MSGSVRLYVALDFPDHKHATVAWQRINGNHDEATTGYDKLRGIPKKQSLTVARIEAVSLALRAISPKQDLIVRIEDNDDNRAIRDEINNGEYPAAVRYAHQLHSKKLISSHHSLIDAVARHRKVFVECVSIAEDKLFSDTTSDARHAAENYRPSSDRQDRKTARAAGAEYLLRTADLTR